MNGYYYKNRKPFKSYRLAQSDVLTTIDERLRRKPEQMKKEPAPIKANIQAIKYSQTYLDLHKRIGTALVENKEEKQKTLMKNYCEYVHNKFNKYAFGFFFCELLNVVITVSQVRTVCLFCFPMLTLFISDFCHKCIPEPSIS